MQHAIGTLSDLNGSLERSLNASQWNAPGFAEVRSGLLFWDHFRPGTPKVGPPVSPKRGMLERFLRLAKAPDQQILGFALSWGVLGICDHGFPHKHDDSCLPLGWTSSPRACYESLDDWRRISAHLGALLRVGASVRNGRVGRAEDWRDVYMFVPRTLMPPKIPWWNQTLAADRAALAVVLNQLIDLTRITVTFDWSSDRVTGALRYSTRGLYGALCLQLMQAIGDQVLVNCSHCAAEYQPQRAPKRGCRNFCPTCRENNIPSLLSSYAFRDRQRRDKGQHTLPNTLTTRAEKPRQKTPNRAKSKKR